MTIPMDPLNIKCRDTNCGEGKHFYQPLKASDGSSAPCRSCSNDDINWARVHQRDLNDIANTVVSLRTEYVRDVYWSVDIDETATNHARRKGTEKLKEDITKRLWKDLAPAELYWDGRQTPKQGNVIYYAQHATATCCRKCLEKWHNIPKGRVMTEEEVAYCVALIEHYIAQRMPNLTEGGEKIPPRRKPRRDMLPTMPPQEDQELAPDREPGQGAMDVSSQKQEQAEPTVAKQIDTIEDILEAKRRRRRDD